LGRITGTRHPQEIPMLDATTMQKMLDPMFPGLMSAA
jgi:hypothetical protein